MDFDRVGFPL